MSLARVRHTYTNEPYTLARSSIQGLNPDLALIPRVSAAQALLEAHLLLAVGTGSTRAAGQNGDVRAFGIESVNPTAGCLTLRLGGAQWFRNFFQRVAPRVYEDDVAGVAGLRVGVQNGDVTLGLWGLPGKIVLSDVSVDMWAAAVEDSDDALGADAYLGARHTLHPCERDWHTGASTLKLGPQRDTQVCELVSGVLRRLHVFTFGAATKFVDLWLNLDRDDAATINIEWAGDLPHFEIIKRLLSPRFGLPIKTIDDGFGCFCPVCASARYCVNVEHEDNPNVRIALRWSTMYAEELPSRRTGRCVFPRRKGFDLALFSAP